MLHDEDGVDKETKPTDGVNEIQSLSKPLGNRNFSMFSALEKRARQGAVVLHAHTIGAMK